MHHLLEHINQDITFCQKSEKLTDTECTLLRVCALITSNTEILFFYTAEGRQFPPGRKSFPSQGKQSLCRLIEKNID